MKHDILLHEFVKKEKVYEAATEKLQQLPTDYTYNLPIILQLKEHWILPARAFKEACGAA